MSNGDGLFLLFSLVFFFFRFVADCGDGLFVVVGAALDARLQRQQEAGQDVVVVQLLAEDEPADRVVVGQQRHHVLQQEALAELEQLHRVVDLSTATTNINFLLRLRKETNENKKRGRLYLGVYVHGDDIVQVDQGRAARLAEAQQAVQLEEVGGRHQFQHVVLVDVQVLAPSLVQVVHDHLECKQTKPSRT